MVAKGWGYKVEKQWSLLSRGLQSMEEPVTHAGLQGPYPCHIKVTSDPALS